MMAFFRQTFGPIVAGLIAAIAIMMLFEFANSFLYPLPQGLDIYNPEVVRAFTASLPWTAYVLVFLGWVCGSLAAGWLTTRLSHERTYRRSMVVGGVLTVLGVVNNVMIGHDVLFSVIALPMFFAFTYVGYLYACTESAKT